jgi:hypothetical protein
VSIFLLYSLDGYVRIFLETNIFWLNIYHSTKILIIFLTFSHLTSPWVAPPLGRSGGTPTFDDRHPSRSDSPSRCRRTSIACVVAKKAVASPHHIPHPLLIPPPSRTPFGGWQRSCWRKIRTLRQAHSKPNKAGLTHEQIPKRASQFFLKLTKDKAVKYQSLELAGWYQTVPYLRLKSHVRWHIAMGSYLSTGWKSFGSFRT